MGTRSLIGSFDTETKNITASYCHYDGYISGVGKTLLESYNDSDSADLVAKGGYLSSLGNDYSESKSSAVNSDPAETFDSYRDFIDAGNECWADYLYLWDGIEWNVCDVSGSKTFKRLSIS